MTDKQLSKQIQKEIDIFNSDIKTNTADLKKDLEHAGNGAADINAYSDYRDRSDTEHLSLQAEPDNISDEDMHQAEGLAPLDPKVEMYKFEIDSILSYRQKQAWKLCMRDGMSQQEAAEEMGVKQQAVASYLATAKKKVLAKFNGQ